LYRNRNVRSLGGTVFELARGASTITTLATFNGANGANPLRALIADFSGNLFGTASAGGANSDGSIFEIKHGTEAITTLVSFNGFNGQYPVGALSLDAAGNLYGTTSEGGDYFIGTGFKLTRTLTGK
jgi:uncharacterized repeat protein (TIGR03803 family)